MKKALCGFVTLAGLGFSILLYAAADQLTNARALNELRKWDAHVDTVIGVVDVQGGALVDLTVKDFTYILPKNDAVTAYAFGPGGGTKTYSGRMQATFKHYNDGRWILVTVVGNGMTFSPEEDRVAAQQQVSAERQAIDQRFTDIARRQATDFSEKQHARTNCEGTYKGSSGKEKDLFMFFCLDAYRSNSRSQCAVGTLPCGSKQANLCYDPYASQQCDYDKIVENRGALPWIAARIDLPPSGACNLTPLGSGSSTLAYNYAGVCKDGFAEGQGSYSINGRNAYKVSGLFHKGVLEGRATAEGSQMYSSGEFRGNELWNGIKRATEGGVVAAVLTKDGIDVSVCRSDGKEERNCTDRTILTRR